MMNWRSACLPRLLKKEWLILSSRLSATVQLSRSIITEFMTDPSPPIAIQVPEGVEFTTAISITQDLIQAAQSGLLAGDELRQVIVALVSTIEGARGFFVAYLTDEHPYADSPDANLIAALRQSPGWVTDLLVKNLAMSTAMALTHQRQDSPVQVTASRRVQQRTVHLIHHFKLPMIQEKLIELLGSLSTDAGSYTSFLQRWGYDQEQQEAIAQVVQSVLETHPSRFKDHGNG